MFVMILLWSVQVLSEDDISVRQGRAVAEAVGILSITPEQAAILLRAYKWNVSHATSVLPFSIAPGVTAPEPFWLRVGVCNASKGWPPG